MSAIKRIMADKKSQVVMFASTAIALYGYDQGMMSLINTNYDYLATMGISGDSPLVGVIVSVYYLGCTVGSVIFSAWADRFGRKSGMFACLATSSLGNLLMFVSGLGYKNQAMLVMFLGRIIMGLGVGGIDSVVPIYSSELSSDDTRGKALAQEFQMNIFGLNIAFAINLAVTFTLGKYNQWAWRTPIIAMEVFPLLLMALIGQLPESPRYYVHRGKYEKAAKALRKIYPQDEFDENSGGSNNALSNSGADETTKNSTSNKAKLDDLIQSGKAEESVSYTDMLFRPSHPQFHPTVVTVMGQVNQALTGYGAVSVYGPQILELLGFSVMSAELITQANYLSYLALMTFAWLLIDAVGRRNLMLACSAGMTVCFFLMTICAGLSENSYTLNIPNDAVAIPGTVLLFIATGSFGIGWLSPVWLIPTEIYPTTARARAAAISVIIWGLANFAVTLLTPIMFNSLSYWIFAIFTITNVFAGWWTNRFLPESGGRSFEENQKFFEEAKKAETWDVQYVKAGEWLTMPKKALETEDGETEPLLGRVRRQI